MKKSYDIFAQSLLRLLSLVAATARADVQMPYGRYIRWVHAAGLDRKVGCKLVPRLPR